MTYSPALCGSHESNDSGKYKWVSLRQVKKMDVVPFRKIHWNGSWLALGFLEYSTVSCSYPGSFPTVSYKSCFEYLPSPQHQCHKWKCSVLPIFCLLPPALPPPPFQKQLFIQTSPILPKELPSYLLWRLDSMRSSWNNFFSKINITFILLFSDLVYIFLLNLLG